MMARAGASALRLVVGALALGTTIGFAAPAAAELPATKLLSGAALVDPAIAQGNYGTATRHTPGAAAFTTATPEVKALARSLGADRVGSATMSQAQFVQYVFDYVRRNIETEFRFGLSKGGRGALIDQSGTAFDQAELMVQLLAQGGVSATFQIGTISLTSVQFGQWTGLVTNPGASPANLTVDAAAACRLLADGGIPATVNGQGTCSGLSGNLRLSGTPVIMGHAWVAVGSTLYDPAFKPHTFKARTLDLASAMHCGTDAAPSCGSVLTSTMMQNATRTPLAGFDTIQNTDEVDAVAKLNDYAVALQHSLESSAPEAELDDVIGGQRIDSSYSPEIGSSLPYPATAWGGLSGLAAIPDQFRSQLIISAGSATLTLYADEIATRQVRIMNGGLYADDTLLAGCGACSDANGNLTLTATHPYAVAGYGQDSITGPVGPLTQIIQGWGEAGPSTQKFVSDLIQVHPDPFTNLITGTCSATVGVECEGDDQPGYAAALLVQRSLANRIVGAISGARIANHHTIGVIAGMSPPSQGLEPSYEMSATTSMSVAPVSPAANDGTSAFEVSALTQSMLEGSTAQQARDSPVGISGVETYIRQNRVHIRFVDIPAGDLANAANLLPWGAYEFPPIATEQYELITSVRQTSDNPGIDPNNLDVILSLNSALQFDLTFKATRLGYFVNGLKGGAAPAPGGTDPLQQTLRTARVAEQSRKTAQASVDVVNGALTVKPAPDLVTGAGDFPFSLPFQRFYNSDARAFESVQLGYSQPSGSFAYRYSGPDEDSAARLPGGWSHNYAITARILSNAQKSFGRDTALDASAAIAAIYTLNDLLKAPDFPKRLAAIYAAHYLGLQLVDNAVSVSLPPSAEIFQLLPDGRYHAPPGSASTLTKQGVPTQVAIIESGVIPDAYAWDYSNVGFTYTDRNGATISFDNGSKLGYLGGGYQLYYGEGVFKANTWSFPNGMQITFTYTPEQLYWLARSTSFPGPSYVHYYLTSVTNSLGRSLTFTSVPTGSCQRWQIDTHGQYTGSCERFVNVGQRITAVTDETGRTARYGVANCGPSIGDLGAGDFIVPSFAMACGTVTVTDPLNYVTRYDYAADSSSPDPAQIDRPNYLMRHLYSASDMANGTGPLLNFVYDDVLRVADQSDENQHVSITYAAGLLDGETTTRGESVDAAGGHWISFFDYRNHRTQAIDPLQRSTLYRYDGLGRLTRTTYPELNAEEETYDLRSNTLTNCQIPKTRPGQSCSQAAGDLLVTSFFMESPNVTTCAVPATCNKPIDITDARSLTTHYDWTSFGEILRITRPADVHGQSPQTTFGYTALAASAATIQFLTSKTERINASVSTTTAYQYNPANKFTLRAAITDQGGLNLTTGLSFDPRGNLVAVDGPLQGGGDTSQYAWDDDRRLVMSLLPLAANNLRMGSMNDYDPDGLLKSVQQGTASSIDPNTFQPITGVAYSYDFVGNKASEQALDFSRAGTPPLTLTQYSYDADDRLECTAVRMNPTVFGTAGHPPATRACNQAASGASVDRISRNSYDAAGQLTTLERGVGSADSLNTPGGTWIAFEQFSYWPNGKRRTLTDAVNNVTTFQYDRFDRLSEIDFPSPLRGAGLSNSAYKETYTYDENGNRRTLTKRDGQIITYGYDNLNRLVTKTLPDTPDNANKNVTYDYDLMNHRTLAAYPVDGKSIGSEYDAAGRKTAETSYGWRVEYRYDEAGNRIRLTWPDLQPGGTDKVYATYAYDNASRLTDVFQNGSAQLAHFVYDGLGRRKELDRPNLTGTTYHYDPAGRLDNLQHTMAAAGQPSDTEGLSYNAAGQLKTLTHGDPFVWKGQPTSTLYDTHDGLNRLSRLMAMSITAYDPNGNLTNDGTYTYKYDTENRMVQAVGPNDAGSIEAFDPLGRIRARFPDPAAPTYFLMDGDHIIAEYGQNGLPQVGGNPQTPPLRRYIFGPGDDEPLVWYEGATPYWLHADREGSIIAWSDSAGVVTNAQSNVNRTLTYGPYGEPSSWSMPRFAYTGQSALPEEQLYYYKARVYSPILGRFLQTDPVGFDAGDTNLYAYVADDPVDHTDSSGKIIDVEDPAQRDKILHLINKKSEKQYKFDKRGNLERDKSASDNKKGSRSYSKALNQAVASSSKISVTIATSVDVVAPGPHGTTLADTRNVQYHQGGGMTTDGGHRVFISGLGNPSTHQDAGDILMHELFGHAMRELFGPLTGNAIQDENLIRRELHEDLREPDPTHIEGDPAGWRSTGYR